jgi:glutathione-regulated potassium-efflux system ancillary protein KefC
MDVGFLSQLVIYLVAMIIAVPLAKWAGLGAVLGYLIAGIALGPFALDLISEAQQQAAGIAEFGIIMMLLLIGLELNPRLLWKLRGPIFGLGTAQVLGSIAVFMVIARIFFNIEWSGALAVGMVLSLSSTAIVLQTLAEKGYSKSNAGKSAFAVLLFQDLAVIPMLAILPLLAASSVSSESPADAAGWLQALRIVGAVLGVLALGLFVVKPLFRAAAKFKLRETFTAIALAIVAGATYLMHMAHLSPALGAFLAGVVLAESEFKHQIETDLEPFKGLLLGLFFISVGAGINFGAITSQPVAAALIVLLIISVKFLVMYVISLFVRMNQNDNLLLSVSLAQGGEFAFVLLALVVGQSIMDAQQAQILTACVAVSMALAPLLISLVVKFLGRSSTESSHEKESEKIEDDTAKVIVIGVGRFGQIVVRMLNSNGIKATVLDYDTDHIQLISRFGIKSYFGDGSNMDLLRSAGIQNAEVVVVAIDDAETALKIVTELRHEFPKLQIISRAYDRVHAYRQINAGANQSLVETAGSAVSAASFALQALGISPRKAFRQSSIFASHNQQMIREMAPLYASTAEQSFVQEAKLRIEAINRLLVRDQNEAHTDDDHAWESAPRADLK